MPSPFGAVEAEFTPFRPAPRGEKFSPIGFLLGSVWRPIFFRFTRCWRPFSGWQEAGYGLNSKTLPRLSLDFGAPFGGTTTPLRWA